jgi:Anti-sigma-K factor rskA
VARELTHQELDGLLGAFALDAVDGEEREQVERYLQRSPRARALVAEYRQTAAFLADPGTEAPPGLWERIEEGLAEEPADRPPQLDRPESEIVVTLPPPRSRFGGPWARRAVAAVAAAAALLVVGVLALKVVQQDDRISDLARKADRGGVLAAAEAASRDPSATKVRLSSPDGAMAARVVYLPDGQGFLVPSNLRPLTPELTYQLWARVGERQSPRSLSAGVLGSDPEVTAFRMRGPVLGFAITKERTPGVVASDNPAVAEGSVD